MIDLPNEIMAFGDGWESSEVVHAPYPLTAAFDLRSAGFEGEHCEKREQQAWAQD